MRFIQFENDEGQQCMVNVEQVIAIIDSSTDKTEILVSTGHIYTANNEFAEVTGAILEVMSDIIKIQ